MPALTKEVAVFNCQDNRLDYGKSLCPPDGYTLDQAVATSYSADLQTLLSIPVALVYSQTLEGNLSEARIQLLEAIKSFSQKVLIYHQKGQLHVPAKANWLYAFLEDALVDLLPGDAFSSFHPKIWLIRYRSQEEELPPLFRLIVLSRNLTFDRSWDVACCLDGKLVKKAQPKNKPLIDFIKWLDSQHPIPRSKQLFEELEHINFELPEGFHEHLFHPIGIPGYRINPIEKQNSDTAIAISRFLHPKALATISENTRRQFHLLSEAADLLTIPRAVRENFKSYYLNDLIIDGESFEENEDGESDPKKQHLHAKLFIFRNRNENTRCFLGSANATEAAFHRNVEFMVELRSERPRHRPSQTLANLVEEDGSGAFVELPPDTERLAPEADSQRTSLRRFEHALLQSSIKAQVEEGSQKGTFDLSLEISTPSFPPFPDFQVMVNPFNIEVTAQPLSSGRSKSLRFSAISESYLSRFLQFEISAKDLPSRKFLLRIPISGLPQKRLEHIFRRMIDSPDKFFQYLQFLLAEEVNKEDLLHVTLADSESNTTQATTFLDTPLYEQLLVASSRAPSKLQAVADIVAKLDSHQSDVIPPEFHQFWDVFQSIIPQPKEKDD